MNETKHLIPNARLNFCENMLLSHLNARSTSKIALVTSVEPIAGHADLIFAYTFEDVYQLVRQAAYALKVLGVKPGDTVAAFSPNNAEAVIMLLATTALGGVWSSCPSEFGVRATLERLSQARICNVTFDSL